MLSMQVVMHECQHHSLNMLLGLLLARPAASTIASFMLKGLQCTYMLKIAVVSTPNSTMYDALRRRYSPGPHASPSSAPSPSLEIHDRRVQTASLDLVQDVILASLWSGN